MLSRTATHGVAYRASSIRRQRRRAAATHQTLYCATNGCTSFLVVDEQAMVARCEICGYIRRIS